jgi:TonB family protein
MKRKILLPLILLSSFMIAKCQDYLDSSYNKVDKNKAIYYRIIEKTKSNDFVMKTFLINDTLIESAHLKSVDPKYRDGKCLEYFPNGKLHFSTNYTDGTLNGESKRYFENGELQYSMVYIDGMLNGELKGYFENGNLRRLDHYKNDILIDGKCYTQTGQDTTYYVFEKKASYNGGDINRFREYVQRQVIYPVDAAENGIQGKVIIQFTVDTNGKVVDVKVLKSPDPLLSRSAIEAVLKSKLWEPALQEDIKVKQQFIMPVGYSLQ